MIQRDVIAIGICKKKTCQIKIKGKNTFFIALLFIFRFEKALLMIIVFEVLLSFITFAITHPPFPKDRQVSGRHFENEITLQHEKKEMFFKPSRPGSGNRNINLQDMTDTTNYF